MLLTEENNVFRFLHWGQISWETGRTKFNVSVVNVAAQTPGENQLAEFWESSNVSVTSSSSNSYAAVKKNNLCETEVNWLKTVQL